MSITVKYRNLLRKCLSWESVYLQLYTDLQKLRFIVNFMLTKYIREVRGVICTLPLKSNQLPELVSVNFLFVQYFNFETSFKMFKYLFKRRPPVLCWICTGYNLGENLSIIPGTTELRKQKKPSRGWGKRGDILHEMIYAPWFFYYLWRLILTAISIYIKLYIEFSLYIILVS